MSRTLVVRLDNAGDVLLAGPAVRAAADQDEVTLLCGPAGVEVARLLPGVTDVEVWEAPWVGFDPPTVDRRATERLVDRISCGRFERGAILTSFHQSPLPVALLLRMAGVEELAAVSVDYPGSLLDHRLPYRPELHEVEQALTVTRALGFPEPTDTRLRVRSFPPAGIPPPYVVVHPSASVPARGLPDELTVSMIQALTDRGWRVVVTGLATDRPRLPDTVPGVSDLRGATRLDDLVGVIAEAEAIVCGNTGPAHIAAAVGTPVVSVFAPVVPARRWRPWQVPHVLLGRQEIECGGCRARACPLPEQECTASVTPDEVITGLLQLIDERQLEPA